MRVISESDLVAVCLGICYFFLAVLFITTPIARIEKKLDREVAIISMHRVKAELFDVLLEDSCALAQIERLSSGVIMEEDSIMIRCMASVIDGDLLVYRIKRDQGNIDLFDSK